jgi:hypothetical protein
MLRQESLVVPLAAIAVGFAGALLSLAGTLSQVRSGIWLLAFATVAVLVVCAVMFVNFVVVSCVEKN